MLVRIPGLLRSYTGGAASVELRDEELASGAVVAEALAALDRRFPGMRFRLIDEQGAIRPHVKLFADGVLVRDLVAPHPPVRELFIVGALSGG